MSFNPNLLVKLEPSSLFTQPATIPAVQPQKFAPQLWQYQASGDTTATVQTIGYFIYYADWLNTLIYNNGQFLQVGDLIYCVCSDSSFWLVVTQIGSIIETVPYGINYISVPLTVSQFEGMYAAPVQLIGAQGPKTVINVDRAIIELVYGGTQYAAGGVVALQYGNTVHGAGPAASATIAAATINGYTANSIIAIEGSIASVATANVSNKGIFISNATGAFTTGNSPLTVNVYYSAIRTSA